MPLTHIVKSTRYQAYPFKVLSTTFHLVAQSTLKTFIFSDLKTLVAEETKKEICRRFRLSGNCPYGDNCNYTHYSEQEIEYFKWQSKCCIDIRDIRYSKINANVFTVEEKERVAKEQRLKLPSIEEWLEKCNKIPQNILKSDVISSNPNLFHSASLPPSLQPISKEQIMNATFSEWG